MQVPFVQIIIFVLFLLIFKKVSLQLLGFNREINKAFCGFYDQSKCQQYQRLFKGDGPCGAHLDQGIQGSDNISRSNLSVGLISLISGFCYFLKHFFVCFT